MKIVHVITAFLENNGRILILKRSNEVRTHKGRWAGVSGYIENGDDAFERALKEIEEETGLSCKSIQLRSKGKVLAVKDGNFLWLVHPFLFKSSKRNVKLDWEHNEYRWILPAEIGHYATVPMLNETLARVYKTTKIRVTDPEVQRRIKKLISDRKHGATQIASEAIRVIVDASNRFQVNNIESYLTFLISVGDMVMNTRPNMAPLTNFIGTLLSRVFRRAESDRDLPSLKKFLLLESTRVLKSSEKALEAIAEHCYRLISTGDIIFTHSYSSTVITVLKYVKKKGKNIEVFVTESRPLFEGRRTAKLLSENRIPITLITDASIGHFMNHADMVIAGADGVLSDGSVLNKIGTRVVASIAESEEIPVYFVCEKNKFDLRSYMGEESQLEENDASEVWDLREMQGISIRNTYFDVTPSKFITNIITESGLIKTKDVSKMMEGMLKDSLFSF